MTLRICSKSVSVNAGCEGKGSNPGEIGIHFKSRSLARQ